MAVAASLALMTGASVFIVPSALAEGTVTICEAGRVWGHALLTISEARFGTHFEASRSEAIEHGYNKHHFDVWGAVPEATGDNNWDATGQAMYENGCVGPERPVNDRPGGAIRLDRENPSDTQFTYHAAWKGEATVAGDTEGDGSGPGGFGDCAYTWNPDVEYMGRSVWYKAVARDTSMTVTISSPELPTPNPDSFSTIVGAVYTRSDGIFTPVVAWGEPDQSCWVSEDGPFTFKTSPGQKYWIQVGGYSWWDYGHLTTQVS